MKRKLTTVAALVLPALLAWACAGGRGSGPDDFVKEAAAGGMAEVQASRLTAERAGSAAVKLFGQRMVEDHTKSNLELSRLAAGKNIQLPQELSADHRATVDKLSKLAGADFDEAYVDALVEEHEKDVEAFQEQSEKGTDPEVRAFAAKTLPVLREHLQMIKDIKSRL